MKEQILFHQLKVGDIIGFSYVGWWKYPIAFLIKLVCFILRKKKNGLDQQHVGQVIKIFREDNLITFQFAEQTGHQGKHITNYSIIKQDPQGVDDKISYMIDSRFRSINYHFLPLKESLTEDQQKKLIQYWRMPEEYVPIDALTSTRIFKDLREELEPDESIYDKDNFCSGACHAALYYAGVHNNTNQVDPVQLSLQPYLSVKF